MTDNELLLALSDMIDKKLQPVKEDIKEIRITQENDILPRLQNIESCYLSTFKRYSSGITQMEAIQADIDIIKQVIAEHSEKLKKIS